MKLCKIGHEDICGKKILSLVFNEVKKKRTRTEICHSDLIVHVQTGNVHILHLNDEDEVGNDDHAIISCIPFLSRYLVNKILLCEFQWFNLLIWCTSLNFSFYHLQLQNRTTIPLYFFFLSFPLLDRNFASNSKILNWLYRASTSKRQPPVSWITSRNKALICFMSFSGKSRNTCKSVAKFVKEPHKKPYSTYSSDTNS